MRFFSALSSSLSVGVSKPVPGKFLSIYIYKVGQDPSEAKNPTGYMH